MTINEEVRTTEYAPALFKAIRDQDKVTDDQIQESLNTEKNISQVFKAKESAGKSGSFFFFSHDKKFLIKTMNERELKVFLDALPDYLSHLQKNPFSLIARIYGIFTVSMENIVPVHLLLMANSCDVKGPVEFSFDLKGSLINRVVEKRKITKGCTLKDQNLLDLVKDEVFLLFQYEDRKRMMKQIYSDITFLCKYNLMDYSLLVIVETNKQWIDLQKKQLQKQKSQSRKQTKFENDVVSRNKSVESGLEFEEQEDFFDCAFRPQRKKTVNEGKYGPF